MIPNIKVSSAKKILIDAAEENPSRNAHGANLRVSKLQLVPTPGDSKEDDMMTPGTILTGLEMGISRG